ncbi:MULTISPECIES: hypothetical protein [Bacillus cereus group]|uniref:Lipoprotein n=1 Tax=Bacillus cereus VD118 TaxID=1053231 RepID=R8Q9J7_BACCE|nr:MULTISPECIES: hypothetical protein [Bacillus cereus group]EOP67432.1 hypothetical protein IIQ_05385 [Bacillus cereus VD118]MBJ8095355.1 hypothetical protein [Bacillus cereus]MCQ6359485.1 hypothetical protein [Bacillus cereus]CAH2464403.1 hypothetical protein ACOSJ1_EBGNOMHC_04937 [Bacillus mycoides KBAB4]
MNKKLVACILALSTTMVACGENSNNKGQETQIQSTQQKEKESQLTKEQINKTLPELSKKIKEILIDNSDKIDKKFDMKNTQVLLVSNISKTAYLINSQDEKYGKKEEAVEYSTDTFKDKGLLTIPFGLAEFNGKQTYLVNIDFVAKGHLEKQALENDLMKFIVHEGVHLILQRDLEGGIVTTAEETMSGERAENYPVLYDARINRKQNIYYYKKALESNNEEDRIKYIKMGNYFYKKYLEMNKEHKNETVFDKLEGQARYLEYRAVAVSNNLDKDENTVKSETKKIYLNENDELKDEILMEVGKDLEYYALGSLAYANIYDMNQEKELNYNNPLQYLLDKYGYIENEGDKEISDKVKKYYDEINTKLKNSIDEINSKVNNDKYIKIKIPVLQKYSENGSSIYEDKSIQYKYNDENAQIENVSKEVRIGENRIKLKSATVVATNGSEKDGIMNNMYVFIPKEDVEINKDKLTVQTKEVQIYDANFIEEKGVYKLVEK